MRTVVDSTIKCGVRSSEDMDPVGLDISKISPMLGSVQFREGKKTP